MSNRTRVIVSICLIGVMVLSLGKMYQLANEYREGEDIYQQALVDFVTEAKNANQQGEVVPEVTVPKAVAEEIPRVPGAEMTIDFAALQKINPDIIGWIVMDDSPINYPLLLGKDNSKYLTTTYNGHHSKMGSIFLDYRNHADFSSAHNLIYGHNMRNNTMFSALPKYAKSSYYQKHRYFYIYTPEGRLKFEIFAASVVTSNSDVYVTRFASTETKQKFLNTLMANSQIKSGTPAKVEDKIFTLSTCTSDNNKNARYVVHGKLIEDSSGKSIRDTQTKVSPSALEQQPPTTPAEPPEGNLTKPSTEKEPQPEKVIIETPEGNLEVTLPAQQQPADSGPSDKTAADD